MLATIAVSGIPIFRPFRSEHLLKVRRRRIDADYRTSSSNVGSFAMIVVGRFSVAPHPLQQLQMIPFAVVQVQPSKMQVLIEQR